jgi:hypothetical protein
MSQQLMAASSPSNWQTGKLCRATGALVRIYDSLGEENLTELSNFLLELIDFCITSAMRSLAAERQRVSAFDDRFALS